MQQLIFKYGTMSAGKTLKLLSEVYDLSTISKNVLILKPSIDTRTKNTVKSRLGVEKECKLIYDNTDLYALCSEYEYVYIDECQFLTSKQVDVLRRISYYGTKVVCFGLLTTFQRKLFEGSRRLLEVADVVEELEGRCQRCGQKATINTRWIDGELALEGDEICIGDEEYKAVCYDCYTYYELNKK